MTVAPTTITTAFLASGTSKTSMPSTSYNAPFVPVTCVLAAQSHAPFPTVPSALDVRSRIIEHAALSAQSSAMITTLLVAITSSAREASEGRNTLKSVCIAWRMGRGCTAMDARQRTIENASAPMADFS
mmetsp:Transcript_14583/g.37274  ORF Transcript_14583/g.37274 Transcript_14583/m.37274 type:complete len:129 (+) Transcript_14583:1124-1510(+)